MKQIIIETESGLRKILREKGVTEKDFVDNISRKHNVDKNDIYKYLDGHGPLNRNLTMRFLMAFHLGVKLEDI